MTYLDPTFQYTAAQREQYEHDGYLLFPRFLSEEGLARCRRECDALMERLHPDRPPEMILSAHVQDRWLFELATEPKLLDLIEAHIGPNLLLWNSHLVCKPPAGGRSIPWHQDETYFNNKGRYPPTIWIALDDVDEHNGGLTVLPGQHRAGLASTLESGRTDFDLTFSPEALAEVEPVHYVMQAGQLAMHHPRMPHCSPPNTSDRWRRVFTFHYIDAEAELATRTYSNYRTGEPFDRQFYLVRGEAPPGTDFPRSPDF